MKQLSKKAEIMSLTCLVLSLGLGILSWILGIVCREFSIIEFAWFNGASVLVWLVLAIYLHLRSLAEQEKLDLAQPESADRADTIFQASREQQDLFAVAQRRLKFFEKWFIPSLSVLIAAYHIAVSIFNIFRIAQFEPFDIQKPQLGAVLMVSTAFISFLMSRVAIGMSHQPKWRELRAGGSYLFANAIIGLALGIFLILAQFRFTLGLSVMKWVIPILMVLLGIEIGFSVVFDFYRPRVPGQENRLPFDSRLLGLFSEPGGILDTFASTVDYQFGFQISQTWFYKLFEKAVLPLFLFGILTLYLLSCFVIIEPGHEGVIEHFGKFEQGGRHVTSGLHVKWPWPFDKAYIYPTSRVGIITIGYEESDDPAEFNKPLLWGKQHFVEEYDVLVASRSEAKELNEDGAVPVSLVRANVPVHYRIRDIEQFMYNNKDARLMLENICYQELTRYAAGSTLETSEEVEGRSLRGTSSLLGSGRLEASGILMERIQQKADEAKLGVEIVLLGLQGVHPPPDLAEDYQKVIGSLQSRQAQVLSALADRNSILSSLAGSVDQANELYALGVEYQQAKESGDMEKVRRIEEQILESFGQASGDIFKTLEEAKAYRFEKGTTARATGQRFAEQLKAYRSSPDIYKQLERYMMLEEALVDTRKYIVVAEEEDQEVYIIDLQEKLAADIYDMPFEELGQGGF